MNKKILSLLLGVTLALSLCACSGKTQGQNTDSTQAAAEADGSATSGADNEIQNNEIQNNETPDKETEADAAGAEKDEEAAEGRTESYPEVGLKLNYPAEFVNTKGYLGTENRPLF